MNSANSAVSFDLQTTLHEGLQERAEVKKVRQRGGAVLAATVRHDEAPVAAEVGEGGRIGYAASRICSSGLAETSSPVSRSRYPAAASAFAAAVMIARLSLRSTFNHKPI